MVAQARSRAGVAKGDIETALSEAKKALAAVAPSGYVLSRIELLIVYGEALLAAGSADEAGAVLQEALELAEQKESRTFANQARQLLGQLSTAAS
jgi:ATP/maltotriose-dependent transcriptional regulator MalT